MAAEVIDLTSDEESPTKLLKSFQPSKSKDPLQSPKLNGNLPNGHVTSKSNEVGHDRGTGRHVPAASTSPGATKQPITSRAVSYTPAADVVEQTRHSGGPAQIPAGVRAAFSDGTDFEPPGFQPDASSGMALQQSELERRERVQKAERYRDKRASPASLRSTHALAGPANAFQASAALYHRPAPNSSAAQVARAQTEERSDALTDFMTGVSAGEGDDDVAEATAQTGKSKRPVADPGTPFDQPSKRVRLDAQEQTRHEAGNSNHAKVEPRAEGRNINAGRAISREVKLVDVTEPSTERVSLSDEPTPPSASRRQFTSEDNALLKRLKEVDGLGWNKIMPYFPDRTKATLQVHYSTKVKHSTVAPSQQPRPLPTSTPAPVHASRKTATSVSSVRNKSGHPYSDEEDALLGRLKDEGLSWEEMLPQFGGRTAGSLQVRWYTKIKQRSGDSRPSRHDDAQQETIVSRSKRARKSNVAAPDGFVSWTDARELMRDGPADPSTEALQEKDGASADFSMQDCAYPLSMSQILRHRETGVTNGRKAWASSRRQIPDELKGQVFTDYTLDQYYHGTSGDVVGLSWSVDGRHFAAGSIAITDSRSMQYNMSRNLLVGDRASGELQELLNHHVPRPVVDEADNPNALTSMQHTQDPRLFLTVTATAFSPVKGKEHWLFTAGSDKMLRRYSVADKDIGRTTLRYSAEHAAPIDLLAAHPERSFVATGCHSAADSINIHICEKTEFRHLWHGSPERKQLDTAASIYPSALKWGEAPVHRRYLLAGFSGDEDRDLAGETALWDFETTKRIEVRGTTRNVFDVAWNPVPSPTSVAFAVASNSMGLNLGKGMRTAVRLFAPTEKGLQSIIKWECPALDINDVVICPYDDNLVAAGATDGKVYVWDQRFAQRSQKPLHVLVHGSSLNVLPHDRDRELTDTGVRFLSWGATKNRLYSGSSDGVVKVWNPYGSPNCAHVQDIETPRQQRAAVMSGLFSPDRLDLLIGTENGQINILKAGGAPSAVHKARPFKLHTGPGSEVQRPGSIDLCDEMVRSNKIEFRPCGAMPITQAVQGPAYDGPFQAPSVLEQSLAESKLQVALDSQNDIASERAQAGHMSLDDDVELHKSHVRVRDAQAAVEDLQDRRDFAEASRPKAEEFQRSLFRSVKDREAILRRAREQFGDDASPCELQDCGRVEIAEEIEDNSRSELRIPGTLRSITNESINTMQLALEDGTELCFQCSPNMAKRQKRKHVLCLSCRLRKLALTTMCSKCSAPARVMPDRKEALCESCAFQCFRCFGHATLSKGASAVYCETCNLDWTAGALGYELVRKMPHSRKKTGDAPAEELYNDFGTWEREHYASLWEVQTEDAF